MNTKILNKSILLYYFIFSLIVAQDLSNLSFGDDNSFDIATWNIEWFPKNGQVTVGYVSDIINLLELDVVAIQEIDNTEIFENMISSLTGYEGYYESYWFAGLGYIYNSETVEVNDFYEIYTTSQYWNIFPRSPMVMDLNFRGQNYIIVNNHLKCCGDGIIDLGNNSDEEFRRYRAMNLLKAYGDENLAEKNVFILGDLNDDIAEQSSNNIFQDIIDDVENYYFSDMAIALGSSLGWSYPSWPSHLDHILITDELFSFPSNPEAVVIRVDDYLEGGWAFFDSNISDHRPVALKIRYGVDHQFDINMDGEINEVDLEMMLGLIMTNEIMPQELDFNFDQEVSIFDILFLIEKIQS